MDTKEIPFHLSVILGQLTLSSEEARGVEVGDILLLSQKVTEPLTIQIKGKRIWQGYPATHHSFKAVRLE